MPEAPGGGMAPGDGEGYDLQNKCQSCGAEMSLGAVMCTACGFNQMTGEAAATFEGEVKRERGASGGPKKAVIVGAVLALLVAGGGFAYYKFVHKKDAGDAPADARPAPKHGATSGESTAKGDAKPSKPSTSTKPGAAGRKSPKPANSAKRAAPKGRRVKASKVFGSDSEWALSRYVRAPRRAKDSASLVSAQQTVRAFEAEMGRPPKDMAEVVKKYGPHSQPSAGLKIGFDPKTKKVFLYEPPKR